MNIGNFIKIFFMIATLGGIIWFMGFMKRPEVLNGPTSDSALGILLGVQDVRPINWCDTTTGPVQIYPADMNSKELPRKLEEKDRARICTGLMEPATLQEAEGEYRPVAQVLEEKGDGPILEQNAKGVFRVKGMPFHSSSLAKVLSELR